TSTLRRSRLARCPYGSWMSRRHGTGIRSGSVVWLRYLNKVRVRRCCRRTRGSPTAYPQDEPRSAVKSAERFHRRYRTELFHSTLDRVAEVESEPETPRYRKPG